MKPCQLAIALPLTASVVAAGLSLPSKKKALENSGA